VVRDVVNRCSEQLRSAGVDVTLAIEDDIVGLVDQMRVEQIVDNLLSNAIKYAPGAAVTLSLTAADRVATLVVDDRGPGIAEDQQALVFERFERATSSRSVSGLGLGLFIVKQIVDGYGGSIDLASRVGQGTRFTVKLPITDAVR
jgi:signal transduction histidine kinase